MLFLTAPAPSFVDSTAHGNAASIEDTQQNHKPNKASLRGQNKRIANKQTKIPKNIISFRILPHHEVLKWRHLELDVNNSWLHENEVSKM
eukprot:7747249-Ditylum_brightwellii.AAC.1